MTTGTIGRALVAFLLAIPASALAQESGVATDSGDTGWVLAATLFALTMATGGIELLFASRVQGKNLHATLLQICAVTAVVSILWIVIGYSLAFSAEGSAWIGSLQNVFFADLLAIRDGQSVGELVFALFQMAFAVLAPLLILGACLDRARLGWVLGFSAFWSLIVYAPVARWLWGGGWLAESGAIDFAGGTVLHTSAGVSALVIALMIGRREVFSQTPEISAPTLAVPGAALLWAGSLALAGGSALTASDLGAGSAIIVTHLAASVAALTWLALERWRTGTCTAIGFASGAIAGIAASAAGAGSVGPAGAMLLGLTGALLSYATVGLIRHRLNIDDTANIFAVHGVGGIVGALLLAPLSSPALGGLGYDDGMGMGSLLIAQLLTVGAVTLWSAFATLVIGYAVAMVLPMREQPA